MEKSEFLLKLVFSRGFGFLDDGTLIAEADIVEQDPIMIQETLERLLPPLFNFFSGLNGFVL